jgi:diguanylate cyclase (GGDEF)-like protein/PAS domain S-box-containing protein
MRRARVSMAPMSAAQDGDEDGGEAPPADDGAAAAALDALPGAIAVLDATGRILATNRGWRAFDVRDDGAPCCGRDGDDFVAACERVGAAVDDAGRGLGGFVARLRAVLAGSSEAARVEMPMRGRAGERWLRAAAVRCTRPGRAAAVVTFEDVTAERQEREVLRRRGELLQQFVDALPGAAFRIVRGPRREPRFELVSPGVRELFGVETGDVCAQPALLAARLADDERAAFLASLERAVADGVDWQHEFAVATAAGGRRQVHVAARVAGEGDGRLAWAGVFNDVTKRKEFEAWFLDSVSKFRTLYETSPTGVVYQDSQGRVTDANPAAQRILGLSLDQMQGRAPVDPRWQSLREDGSVCPGDELPAMAALRTGQPAHNVVMGVVAPGREPAWILVNAIPIGRDGRIEYVYSSFEDVTERRALANELRHLALTDALTGLPNRRSILQRIASEHARVRRRPEIHSSVLAIDLDHFKRVNDEFGHAAGDAVLRHFADVASRAIRRADAIGRSGGEEFLVLLPDTSLAEARQFAERLRREVAANAVAVDGRPIAFTISIGVAGIAPEDGSIDAALARADRALYDAKRAGRDTVRP